MRRDLYWRWGNGVLYIGRGYYRGPGFFEVALAWNDREALRGAPVQPYEPRYADCLVLWWRRPFSGLHLTSERMDWRQV